jgi:hypothetical protein
MSYSFEGKIVNQQPRRRGFASQYTICERCYKMIQAPECEIIKIDNKSFYTYNYLNTDYFIYETKSSCAVSYCSKECRDKHNHRYNRG